MRVAHSPEGGLSVEFRVLGPLEVVTAGGPLPLTGPKRRALLALLLVNAGEVLSADRIADDLWSGNPPRSVSTTLPTFVYQLRRRFGIDAVRTTPAGYVLDVEPDAIDAGRFEHAVSAASTRLIDGPHDAMRALREALAMWRGPAYGEFAAEPWAVAEAARLEELRLETVEAWAVAAIGARETSGVPGELEAWTSRQPMRESLWALRMLALAHDGRAAEAVRVGTHLRHVLGEELGVDPSAQFSALETSIIRGEEFPDWPELGGFGLAPTYRSSLPETPDDVRNPRRRFFAGSDRPRVTPARTGTTTKLSADEVFVGRDDELLALEGALETSLAGVPQIVLIAGESGVGKSRLVDEFTPRAIGRGAQLLSGACQEDVGVPYLPIATALASLYGPGAVNPFEAGIAPRDDATDDADVAGDARLRLFLSTTRTLLSAAAERPTMLVIEDVNWIDDATLGLLRHITSVVTDGATARVRLLIVLTSREPDPASPVATLFARLVREQRTHLVALGVLGEYDCRQLIEDWLDERPAPAVVDRLVEAAAGNPLVLRSAVTRLRAGDPTLTDPRSDLLGVTDLDRELWKRLEQVGDACGEMVLDAAFLGDGGRLDHLAAVCDVSETKLDELLDEASEHQVMVTDGDQYWFAHPQLRQLVYHWPPARDRGSRHLRVANCLATRDADVLAVAHHLVLAGEAVEPGRLLTTCGEAADRATAIGAWREAARYAASALRAGATLQLAEDELAGLQLRAGYAALLGGERDKGLAQLGEAARGAEESGALETWGRALAALARERATAGDLRASNQQNLQTLDEYLAAVGDDLPALRAEVHALEAEIYVDMNESASARRHALLAEELAADLHDDSLRARIVFARGLQAMSSVQLPSARAAFESALRLAQESADPSPRIWSMSRLGLVEYVTGVLDRAATRLNGALELARSVDLQTEYSMAAAVASAVAAAQGRFATVESHAERARLAYAEAEYAFTPVIVFPTLAAARAHRGDHQGAHEALDAWDGIQGRRSRRYRPLVDALSGDRDAARRGLDAPPFRLFSEAPHPDLFLMGAIAAQVELGALVGMRNLVEGPLTSLTELYELGMRFTVGWPAFIPRVVALAFDVLGDDAASDDWFDRALDDAQRSAATAEIARTALDHARVLEARAGARGLVADRRELARQTYAQLSIRPRVGGAEVLSTGATSRQVVGSDVTRIVLVTDLVSSTMLNDALGDREYLELLRKHDELVRRHLVECDGVEFKHTGDGIAAWFLSVNNALRCAEALRSDFHVRSADLAAPLELRIALTAGAPTLVDGDLLGITVTLAFRIVDLAEAGDVLLTSDVAGLARGLGWSFERHGTHHVKGVHDAIEVLRVRPSTRT